MNRIRKETFKKWVIGTLAVVVFFILVYAPSKRDTVTNPNNEASSTVPVPASLPTVGLFDHLKLQAKAAYVLDITTNQVIFAKNENTPLPLASITKLMTAFVGSKFLDDKATVTISTSSAAIEGESGLQPNELWTFKDLRNFTLMVSSNDGANAIALAVATTIATHSSSTDPTISGLSSSTLEALFANEMNTAAASLNLPTLHFQNSTGLDVDTTTPGAIGSAKDVSEFLRYLVQTHPDIVEITKNNRFKFTSLSGINHTAVNTDEDITRISGIIASKTGYTLLAGGNLVIAYNPGLIHPIIITVLGSTAAGRFSDTLALASSTRAYLKSQ
ncbi:MAG TPA: hypothetical protein VFA52_01565 [Candidatus Paceibacterota bacterium]|nr:hypothetical protein [Candidatus Paceibacterota bacterium]